MTWYRKKPVQIEAWRYQPMEPWPEWLKDAARRGAVWHQGGDRPYFTIRTDEGEMRANLGDWIIKGVEGELYPCRHSVFVATYEEVS